MVSDELYTNESLKVFAKNLRKKDDLFSRCRGNLINNINIDRNTDKLAEYLEMTNITIGHQQVSKQAIHRGTELFLYINTCLSLKESVSVRDYWNTFYQFFFTETISSQQKVLSLFKIITDNTSKDGQDIANIMMAKLSKELGFKYYTPQVTRGGIIGDNVNWKKNIENITGIHGTFTSRE